MRIDAAQWYSPVPEGKDWFPARTAHATVVRIPGPAEDSSSCTLRSLAAGFRRRSRNLDLGLDHGLDRNSRGLT